MKEKFGYKKSVTKLKTITRKWRQTTLDMARELYLAKEFITSQKTRQKETPSWSDYCEEIGLHYKTANIWLRHFSPLDLPKDNERKTTKRRKA